MSNENTDTPETWQERLARIEKSLAETDKIVKETARERAENERIMRERSAKLDAMMIRTDRQTKSLNERYGGIAKSNGEVAEQYFAKALQHRSDFGGVHYDMLFKKLNKAVGET
ncbi:MAG: hypothetical protein LBN39_13385, partial [Planctomycetaceae bacterium]|nr:hypothetical protein [Planctomycetaceae bacterium]